MANVFAYASIFQDQLDKQIAALSTSNWMEGNAGLVQYNGGNTVKIPKITMDGLANYSRATGFVAGSSTLSYETMTLSQERGRQFMLDSQDIDETNFVMNASVLMSEFQRTQVVPEIDSYRYSKLAQLAISAGNFRGGYTPAKADIISQIKADISKIQDNIGAVPLVITMSTATLTIIESSTELTRQLQVGTMSSGMIDSEVKMIDECPIVEVPSFRLHTAYTFYDGVTAGQTQGGFIIGGTAKTINWIISASNAPIAISKTDKVRIFTPEQNQDADAFKVDYRKYHDLWVPDNKLASVFVCTKEA